MKQGWLALYRQPEAEAHYPWRHGVLVALCLLATLVGGWASGDLHGGVIAALATWFMGLAQLPRSVGERAMVLGRRLLFIMVTTTLGVLCSGSLVATVLVMAAIAVMIPAPGVTITPVITFIMGLETPSGMSGGHHVLCFALGGAVAAVVLLLGWAGSPVASDHPEIWIRHPLHRALRHVRTGSPQAWYAMQVAITVPLAYLVLHLAEWPHLGWVLVGVLTTLRPQWQVTRARLVKRSIGMVGGALLTTGCLVACEHLGLGWQVLLVALLGGAARPLRQLNYGYWPVLGTPVLLVLVHLDGPLTAWDSVWRLANNLLGAAITLAITWSGVRTRSSGA